MSTCVLATRVVTEVDALERELAELEQRPVFARGTVKRRGEHAAGRLAAHHALTLLRGAGERRAILTAEGPEQGRPRVIQLPHGQDLDVTVSITHADGLAVALACEVAAGLDLVTLEDHGEAFAREAFAPGELAAWRGLFSHDVLATCAAFAFKESVLKWLRVGMGLSLQGLRVLPRSLDRRTAPSTLRLDVEGAGTPCPELAGWLWTEHTRVLALVSEDHRLRILEPAGGLRGYFGSATGA
ncbi:MAG: 4'-phosphopantetheinyl transferase superfamily protein [Myxococcota bacterium]